MKRSHIIMIQCWWRQCIARNELRIAKVVSDQEWLTYWMCIGIENAPDDIKDMFSGMETIRS